MAGLIFSAAGWTTQSAVFVIVFGGLALCMIVGAISYLRHWKSTVVKITSSQLVVVQFGRTRVVELADISSIEERPERIVVVAAGKAVEIGDWQFVDIDARARFLRTLYERVSRVQSASGEREETRSAELGVRS